MVVGPGKALERSAGRKNPEGRPAHVYRVPLAEAPACGEGKPKAEVFVCLGTVVGQGEVGGASSVVASVHPSRAWVHAHSRSLLSCVAEEGVCVVSGAPVEREQRTRAG